MRETGRPIPTRSLDHRIDALITGVNNGGGGVQEVKAENVVDRPRPLVNKHIGKEEPSSSVNSQAVPATPGDGDESTDSTQDVESAASAASEDNSSAPNSGSIPGKFVSSISEEDLMFVEVGVKTGKYKAVVDSGAPNSFISSTIVDQLGLEISREHKQFNVIGGKLISTGKVTVDLQIQNVSVGKADFLVFEPNPSLKIEFLLEEDFLKSNRVELHVKSRLLIFNKDDGSRIEFYADKFGQFKRVMFCQVPCFASQSTTLEVGQCQRVPINCSITVPDDHLLMYEDSGMNSGLADKVHGLQGLACNNSVTSVFMVTTDSKVNISKGERVGVVNSVYEVGETESLDDKQMSVGDD